MLFVVGLLAVGTTVVKSVVKPVVISGANGVVVGSDVVVTFVGLTHSGQQASVV